jgi:hypothetical protein
LRKKYLVSKNINIVSFNGIKKFLQDYLFEDFRAEFIIEEPELRQTIEFLVINLTYLLTIYLIIKKIAVF